MTRTVQLTLGGVIYDAWLSYDIRRDLAEGCASFELEVQDVMRVAAALPGSAMPLFPALKAALFQACEIAIDGELVLRGWLEDVSPEIDGSKCSVHLSGRDLCCDLVDCAAAPKGPVEYRDIKLEKFVEAVCKPFGIGVTVEVDTGEPLRKISIDTGETAWSAIEKAARTRAVLCISDGVANVVLTRSGTGQAPGPILFGTPQCMEVSGGFSARERFSDWYVKGQAGEAAGKRKPTAPVSATADAFVPVEVSEGDDGDEPTGRESRAVTIQGHARDGEVGRYRPKVLQTRGAGQLADAKTTAQWYVNTSKGRSEGVSYKVLGHRGATGGLWRPNEIAMVVDPYQDLNKPLLVAGVAFTEAGRGPVTELRIVGKTAFDILPEGEDAGGGGGSSNGGGTADESGDVEMVQF